MKSSPRKSALLAIFGLMIGAAIQGHAAIEWAMITHNGNADVSSQLQMTVRQGAAGEVDLCFQDNAPGNSAITGVYFDYGSLANNVEVAGGKPWVRPNWLAEGPGLSFDYNGSANLPGGSAMGTTFDSNLALGSLSPRPSLGLQNSTGSCEYNWLTVKLLLDNTSYAQFIDALNSGDFRVGLSVQSFAGYDGSDSYVTTPVPEPTTILAGLFLVVPFGLSMVRFLLVRRVD